MLFLGLFFVQAAVSAQAASSATTREIREPYLQVFVIDPPRPITWTSPRTLLIDTFINGAMLDFAPNGHLAVYIKTRKPNRFGKTEILTGMARTHKMKTMWDTIVKQYGLSAMTTTFSGDLDSADATNEELRKAAKSKRLSSIRVQLNDASAAKLMEFMDNWISYGSYLRYGGNKNVPRGEGSGCADFAVHFIRLALGGVLPFPEWHAEVYLPYALLQENPHSAGSNKSLKKISMWDMAMSGTPWGKNETEGLFFTIPDPERMTRWILKKSPYHKKAKIFPEDYARESYLALDRYYEAANVAFGPGYPRQSESVIRAKWESISVKR